jgi:hypothetical protein
MAKPSARDIRLKEIAQALSWEHLAVLWGQIKAGATPEWDQGKALEHLVIRSFELSRLTVEYPYDVPPGGDPLEQIDGIVLFREIPFLIECKDKERVDVEPIAKLHNQLSRRPPATMGCIFTTGNFTPAALTIADFMVPHRILLWPDSDIEEALHARDFRGALRRKYRELCMYGLTDLSSSYKSLKGRP